MEELKKEMREHDLLGRWKSLEERWEGLGHVDGVWVEYGVEDEDIKKLKTAAFQNWLLRFECPNSLLYVSRKQLVLFAAQERLDLYLRYVIEAKTQKKDIYLVPRLDNAADGLMNTRAFFDQVRKFRPERLGLFATDKHKGKLVDLAKDFVTHEKATIVDVSKNVQELLSRKDAKDLDLVQKCAEITCYFFDKLITHIEHILDQNKKETHAQISKAMDDLLASSKRKIASEFSANPSFYDFAYTPIIQSGGVYDLRPNVENSAQPLQQDCILLNLGGKYLELNCNVYRTVLINPEEGDKANYNALAALHQHLLDKVVAGEKLASIFQAGVDFFKTHHPHLVDKLPNNFGFGIGYEFRESCLIIKADSEKEVLAGQVFTVITSLKGLTGLEGKTYSMHLSDTLVVKPNGKTVVVTQKVPSKLEDVAYRFDDEEPEAPKPREPHAASEPNFENVPRSRAAKREQMQQEQERIQAMKEHQRQLLNAKDEEFRERVKDGNFNFKSSDSTKITLDKLQTYTASSFPKGLRTSQINVDAKHFAVLLPVGGSLVPFHIACVKNVTRHQDQKVCSLRFNFHTPGIASSLVFPATNTFGGDPIYIKELFFKSTNAEQMSAVLKEIKELQKKHKQSLARVGEVRDEKVVLRNQLEVLKDIKMRPTLAGKKTVGTLTAFANGFRFTSKRNEIFELPLARIKHAIFQKCDDNMIIILHFALRHPIEINRKMTSHVQFFTEVGFTVEDLNDPRRKNRTTDLEEFEEEEMEEKAREHYNELFLKFVTNVERGWDSSLRFDSPFPELGFQGSTNSNTAFIMPTTECLVSLIEQPFLILSLDEIEFASIERVDNKIKNFDMVIVFRDYSRHVQHITNIPKTYLEMIKKWLDEQNILFLEGGINNFSWDLILREIRSKPEEFVEKQGCWKGFFEDEDEEDNEDKSFEVEQEEDSAYEEDEEDEEDEDEEFNESELVDEDEELESLEGEEDDEEFDEEDFSDEESVKKKKNNKKK